MDVIFFIRSAPEDDLSILYVRQGLNGKDEVLIDPHTLSTDHTTDIGLLDASNDGKLVVYSIRRGGQDETELRVMDVDKRKDVDQLPNALYRGVSIKRDGTGGRPLSKIIEDVSLELAFLFWQLRMDQGVNSLVTI